MWSVLSSGELLYNNKKIKRFSIIQTRILVALLLKKNSVVTKDELIETGWPGKFVVQNSLNVVISSLRKTLKEIEAEIDIETVPKRGFIINTDESFSIFPDVASVTVDSARIFNESDSLVKEGGLKSTDGNHSSIKKSHDCLMYYFFISILLILFGFSIFNERPKFCYTYNYTHHCGVIELSPEHLDVLKGFDTEENAGEYIYGFNFSIENFFMEKIR